MQSRQDAVGSIACCIQHAFGEEARAVERDGFVQASSGVIANKFSRTAACPEASDCIGFDRCDLRKKCLEFHVRKGQTELLHDCAARCGVALLEAFKSLIARCVAPSDPHGFFVAAICHDFPQTQRRLRIGKTGAEHIGRALRTRGHMHTRIRDDAQDARFARNAMDAQLHARVHRAHEHIDFVALHEALRILHAFGGVGFIIHLEILNLTAAKLAALLVDRHAETVFNRHAKLGECAGVGQHEANADFVGLCLSDPWQREAARHCAKGSCRTGQNRTTCTHIQLLKKKLAKTLSSCHGLIARCLYPS